MVVERNGVKFGNFGNLVDIEFMYVDLFQMACDSKTIGSRAKRAGIWDSETLVIHIWGKFGLVLVKGIFGSFGVVFYKWPAI